MRVVRRLPADATTAIDGHDLTGDERSIGCKEQRGASDVCRRARAFQCRSVDDFLLKNGVGNDIGYDSANGYPNSIPCDQTPFGTSGGSGFVNTITGARTLVRDGSSSSSYWWGMPWLGELYPDAAAADWLGVDAAGVPRGNLRAGSGSGRFRQLAAQTVHGSSSRAGYGTRMTNSQQRLQEEGCTSFFNTGTSSSTFHHQFSSGTGSLTSSGDEIAQNYNFNMPTTAPISRPFGLQTSGSGTVGTEWNSTPYSSNRYPSSLRRMYYNHPSGNVGSGLVELENPARSDSAFLVVNGIDRTVESALGSPSK